MTTAPSLPRTYEEAVAAIDTIARPNEPDTPARFAELLTLLGNPERDLRVVLVGGTNGKGSVSGVLAGVLAGAGLRVGLLPKPHLRRFNERCVIDGRPIGDADLLRLTRDVLEATAAWAPGGRPVRPPELRYLVWLRYLAERRPDVCVIEVNEGGREDVTAALRDAELTVVTNVSLDHQDTLGDDVLAIAGHKAGVVRAATPLVTGVAGEAAGVVLAEAQAAGAPVLRLGEDVVIEGAAATAEGCRLRVRVGAETLPELRSPLLGGFQFANLALAAAGAVVLRGRGWPLDDGCIVRGVAGTRLPGRFQVVDRDPLTILDGAHNRDKAAALVDSARELLGSRPLAIVVSTAASRVGEIVPIFARGAEAVFATRSTFPRAAEPEEIARAARAAAPSITVERAAHVGEATWRARRWAAERGGAVVVTGAFITLGEVTPEALAPVETSGSEAL